MSDYDDYRKDEARWARDLDDLAKVREADEWERRLRALVSRTGETKKTVLSIRSRLVRDAVRLRPALSEAEASAWVDGVLGLQDA